MTDEPPIELSPGAFMEFFRDDEPGPNFEGLEGGTCEHRTVGMHRAWCHNCSQWCYPRDACQGCQLAIYGYFLEVGSKMTVSSITRYPTGTVQITLKPR